MKIVIPALVTLLAGTALAFPPAPFHEIYGVVRDESGNPVDDVAVVRINGTSGVIHSGPVDASIAPGVNYSLKVPMDAATESQLYQANALSQAAPFTLEVIIGGVSYLPLEVIGDTMNIGAPGLRTRLDLTLGVDSDGDGLPDSWEQTLIDALDGLSSLEDVTPDGDADGDGVSNLNEYLAGTYAFDRRASFALEIVEVKDGFACMRFLAVKGRSYRLQYSTGLTDFEDAEFSLEEDGSPSGKSYLSSQVQYKEIFVPADLVNQPKAMFRLNVE